MGCKAHFRNITTTRFPTGGGIVRYNMRRLVKRGLLGLAACGG